MPEKSPNDGIELMFSALAATKHLKKDAPAIKRCPHQRALQQAVLEVINSSIMAMLDKIGNI